MGCGGVGGVANASRRGAVDGTGQRGSRVGASAGTGVAAGVQGRRRRDEIFLRGKPKQGRWRVSPVRAIDRELSTDTGQKALRLNLDNTLYGTFAEIGAGQEVSRWFFRVGGAAGTVAKAVSAYDMTISDTLYGACDRYVTRERLESMLDYEFLQVQLPLNKDRGDATKFFAFANTLVAQSYMGNRECHGWIGLKFQHEPRAKPSTLLMHIRMLDATAQLQQEAVGTLGVNLINACFYLRDDVKNMLGSLSDGLGGIGAWEAGEKRIEVDLADLDGPAFSGVDNRMAALHLITTGLTDAAFFASDGKVLLPSEELRKKHILVHRGVLRPPSNLDVEMLRAGAEQLFCTLDSSGDGTECLLPSQSVSCLEMMMDPEDEHDEAGFLDRVDMGNKLGHPVFVTKFFFYFSLVGYFARFSRQAHVLTMGIPGLKSLFDEKYYDKLEGGLLEAFGRLLKFDTKIYVYPDLKEGSGGEIETVENVELSSPVTQKLFEYLREKGAIVSMSNYKQEMLSEGNVPKSLREAISEGDAAKWKNLVPEVLHDDVEEKFCGKVYEHKQKRALDI